MAAKETTLGSLHEKLAQHFIRVLDEFDRQRALFEQKTAVSENEDVFDGIQEPVLDLADGLSPALLGVMIKFLKDNDITCNPDAEDSSTQKLRDQLKNSRRNVGNVTHLEIG